MSSELVNALVGTPYVLGSTDPEVGLDCWTLVLTVYRALGKTLPVQWDAGGARKTEILRMFRVGRNAFVPTQSPQLFDLIASIDHGHVGLWLGDGLVLHASRGLGVAITREDAFRHLYPNAEFFKAPTPCR